MLHIKVKKRNKFLLGIGATLMAASIFGVALYKLPAQDTNAAGETIETTGPVSGRVNQQVAVTGVSISGAINTSGNDPIPVKLVVTKGSLYMTTTTGLTFIGPKNGASLLFSGTLSDLNTALSTLHYVGTAAGADTLTISLADNNTIFNPSNNHVYQYVPVDSGIDWNDALIAAAASSYDGAPGYLATITSQDENDFIKDRLNGNGWLGASDGEEYQGEGHWSWIGGPEEGTNFYNGQGWAAGDDGMAVAGNYTNWSGPDAEPNDSGNEDCMETYISDGTWNDFPCTSAIEGYVVEYGDDTVSPSGIPTDTVAITTASAVFAGGDGSVQAPYQVTDCEQLQNLNQDLSAHYIIANNIDCTDTPNWNGGQGFLPIGGNLGLGEPFQGTIEGGGYAIDGLTIIRADDDPNTDHMSDPDTNQENIGLIGHGSNITINDLHLTHAKIKGYRYVGGLVGYLAVGTITNSSVNEGIDESADTSCTPGYCVWARYGEYGGGLVGYAIAGNITNSKVGGLVKGSGNIIGGLVGHTEFMTSISNSSSTAAIDGGNYIGGVVGDMVDGSSLYRVFATGNVIAKVDDEVGKSGWYAGGLVGHADNISIEQSYATGNIHADDRYAGGLAGVFDNSTLSDSYATGNIDSVNYDAGGLIGSSESSTIARAYASGTVSASATSGGLIGLMTYGTLSNSFASGHVSGGFNGGVVAGYNSPILENNYYDVEGTGQTSCTSNEEFDCTQVNNNGSQPVYLVDYVNEPFSHSSTRVWSEGVWYFDGVHYPVLRMGTNSTASTRPFIDDNDGISAVVENAAPNNGDGNNDGTQDSAQANVVSFINPVTNKYVTIEVDSSCSFTTASSAAAQANSDSSFLYPFGLLHYTVDCGTPGFTTNVKIYYHNVSNTDGLVVRKYNTTTNTYATVSSATISGSSTVLVTYTIKDGSALDEDGIENGSIVDPVGLGILQTGSSVGGSGAAIVPGLPNTGFEPKNAVAVIVSGITGMVFVGTAFLLARYVYKKIHQS